jgi:hypothetical protein
MGLRPFMQLKLPCIMRLALYPYRKLPMYFFNEAVFSHRRIRRAGHRPQGLRMPGGMDQNSHRFSGLYPGQDNRGHPALTIPGPLRLFQDAVSRKAKAAGGAPGTAGSERDGPKTGHGHRGRDRHQTGSNQTSNAARQSLPPCRDCVPGSRREIVFRADT